MLWSNNFNKLNLIKDDIYVENLLGIEIDTLANNVFEVNNSKKIKLFKYSTIVKENKNDIANKFLLKNNSRKITTLIEDSNKKVLSGTFKTNVYINNKPYNHSKEHDIKKPTVTNENKTSVIKVDVNIDTKAVKLAETAFKKIKRYSDDKEAMEAIDIIDKNIITEIPFYSLCNRIRRFAFKDGFYNGYKKQIEKQKEIENINKLINKKNKAEKKIRVLKTLSKILSKILFSYTSFNITNLEEIVKDKQEIDSKTLKSIYSKKDLKAYNAINKIITLLELTKNKEIFKKIVKETN